MTVVEIATWGTVVSVEGGLLRVGSCRLPPEDVDLLIAAVPAVTITGEALALLGRLGIGVVVCDHHHLPVSVLAPAGCGAILSPRTLRLQAGMAARQRDALWRQIVRAKINAQADVLHDQGAADAARLRSLARGVTAGDPDNKEAQAARLYWGAAFGADFRRGAADESNAMLDFGYAVLRAVVARQLHGAGLHRALGLHHDSAENDGNLADDLIEPFRPAVDRQVLLLRGQGLTMGTEARRRLAALPDWPVRVGAEWQRARTSITRLVLSLRAVVVGGPARLELPQRIGGIEDAGRMAEDVGSCVL